MVDHTAQTIQTSNWAHNCGMHVVADFLIEKLQQDDFKTQFSTKVYDELLKTFQDCYQQQNLTWENIRDVSSKTARIDSQIIWGFVLRQILV